MKETVYYLMEMCWAKLYNDEKWKRKAVKTKLELQRTSAPLDQRDISPKQTFINFQNALPHPVLIFYNWFLPITNSSPPILVTSRRWYHVSVCVVWAWWLGPQTYETLVFYSIIMYLLFYVSWW
jgi:hypothetical protein